MTTSRKLQAVIESVAASDGAGVKLRRSLGSRQNQRFDPFLMLDEFFSDDPDDYLAGFPSHPHRGFETVTYMLDGHMRHEDSFGNRRDLGPGDVQWMTAARGIIHSDMPLIHQGLLHGFPLWINLPAAQKMKNPEYRQATARELPQLKLANGGLVRAFAGHWTLEGHTLGSPLAGMAVGARALDVQLPAGAQLSLDVPAADTVLAYVYQGVLLAGLPIQKGQLARFGKGEQITLTAGADGVRLLLLAGTPLAEPIAQHGPFVMNTEAEIRQAIADYRNGTLTVTH